MGLKNICFNCRKSFNIRTNSDTIREGNCPECGQPMKLMNHRFRPPKKDDDKKWQTVKYPVDNGFTYQHIYQEFKSKDKQKIERTNVVYPDNLRDAKEFVTKYKDQRIKN